MQILKPVNDILASYRGYTAIFPGSTWPKYTGVYMSAASSSKWYLLPPMLKKIFWVVANSSPYFFPALWQELAEKSRQSEEMGKIFYSLTQKLKWKLFLKDLAKPGMIPSWKCCYSGSQPPQLKQVDPPLITAVQPLQCTKPPGSGQLTHCYPWLRCTTEGIAKLMPTPQASSLLQTLTGKHSSPHIFESSWFLTQILKAGFALLYFFPLCHMKKRLSFHKKSMVPCQFQERRVGCGFFKKRYQIL